MLSRLGRTGIRLYQTTVRTWDERPDFRIKKRIGPSGAQDPAVQIYLSPAPTGGPGKPTQNPNISDIYRWTDWGTEPVTITPKQVGDPLRAMGRGAYKEKKLPDGRVIRIYPALAPRSLYFPGYDAKTIPASLFSFEGGPDLSHWHRPSQVTRNTRPRLWTRIIQDYLQKKITPAFEEAVKRGLQRGMRGEKG